MRDELGRLPVFRIDLTASTQPYTVTCGRPAYGLRLQMPELKQIDARIPDLFKDGPHTAP